MIAVLWRTFFWPVRSNSGCNCPDLTIGHPVGQTSWNNNCFNMITVLNNVYIYFDINFSSLYHFIPPLSLFYNSNWCHRNTKMIIVPKHTHTYLCISAHGTIFVQNVFLTSHKYCPVWLTDSFVLSLVITSPGCFFNYHTPTSSHSNAHTNCWKCWSEVSAFRMFIKACVYLYYCTCPSFHNGHVTVFHRMLLAP